jgi:TRAP-type mannitol/chloroaromatic compound transport system permease small subunit
MHALLRVSGFIDALTERVGRGARWLILAAVLICAGNATVRYSLNLSSNAWLEVQWYLYAAVFLLCAGYALKHNQHVRVDVLASRLSRRAQTWIEIFGTLFFLLPMALLILALSWPVFVMSWKSGEVSANANGLVLWPARLLVPVGFALLVLQGIAELIKRIAFLRGLIPDPAEKAGGSERELAEAILKSRGSVSPGSPPQPRDAQP